MEGIIKASLANGYLSCPIAWKIAKETDVPKIAVGEIADRLGIRVTNCQIGCFKVEKTLHDNPVHNHLDDEIINVIETLAKDRELTCARVFDLARQFKLKPMAIADEVNARNLKVGSCQLGCF